MDDTIELEVSDTIPSYVKDDHISMSVNLLNKKEMLEFKSDPYEVYPEDGYFNHQKLIIRYFNQYDRLLNINEAGTGKSSVIAGVCENFKEMKRKNKTTIRKWVILVPNDNIKTEIVRDILARGNYVIDSSADNLANATTKTLKKADYEFYTNETFLNQMKNREEYELKELFSNVLFFVDEAHKLLEFMNDTIGNISLYNLLWKIFHTCTNIKIMLTSATPMMNDVNEIIPLLNLLNKENEQLEFSKDHFYPYKRGLEFFIKGKISYVKNKRKINIDDIGEGMKLDKFKVITIQTTNKCYYDVYNSSEPNEPVETDKTFRTIIDSKKSETIKSYKVINKVDIVLRTKRDSYTLKNKTIRPLSGELVTNEKQINDYETEKSTELIITNEDMLSRSNKTMVVGSEIKLFHIEMSEYQYAMYKKINDSKDIYGSESQVSIAVNPVDKPNPTKEHILNTNDIYDYLRKISSQDERLEALKRISPKFYFIISNELKKLFKKDGGTIHGKSYIYYPYIDKHRKLLSIFNLFGFKESNGVEQTKKLRYCILDSTDKTKTNDKKKMFNKEENKYGEYIQLIIFGEAFAEGMNLDSMLKCYIISPPWNYSKLYQIIARGIRATSHNRIMNNVTNLDDNKLNMRIYKLACVYKKFETSDLIKYNKIEQKKIHIDIVLRELKNASFDKILNRFKNNEFIIVTKEDVQQIDGKTVIECKPDSENYRMIDTFQNLYIEQVYNEDDDHTTYKIESYEIKDDKLYITIENRTPFFNEEITSFIIYDMSVDFDKYKIKDGLPVYSITDIKKADNLIENNVITDYSNYNLNYSEDEVNKYKRIIKRQVDKKGHLQINTLIEDYNLSNNPYILYKAVNSLLFEKNYQNLHYKLINSCLHVSSPTTLTGEYVSTKNYNYTLKPFTKQIKTKASPKKKKLIVVESEVISNFEELSADEKIKTLFWNKVYARENNKIILEHYLKKYYEDFINYRRENPEGEWVLPEYTLNENCQPVNYKNEHVSDNFTLVIINLFSFYIYIQFEPMVEEKTYVENLITQFDKTEKTKKQGNTTSNYGKSFINFDVSYDRNENRNELLIYHTYKLETKAAAVQTLLSVKIMYDRDYNYRLAGDAFYQLSTKDKIDGAYIKLLFMYQSNRIEKFIRDYNINRKENYFYSLLPDTKLRQYGTEPRDDGYKIKYDTSANNEISIKGSDFETSLKSKHVEGVVMTKLILMKCICYLFPDPEPEIKFTEITNYKTYIEKKFGKKGKFIYKLMESKNIFILYV